MSAPGIEISGLCFRIGDWVMDHFTLSLQTGEYLVLSGPNGAGKTLLLKLICGLYRPEAGTILLRGRDVTALPPWQREVGYVPQDGLLFPHCDVRGNIAFGLNVRGCSRTACAAAVKQVADLVGIQALLDRRPQGLSGGERQRVCLARALILEPKILLLDEPVSAIDENARDPLCREIRAIQQRLQITTIHISHNSHETGLVADHIGRLDHGRLVSLRACSAPPLSP